ncbi:MAG TPA: AraC family transcriptional regulator [Drouetiella sp.]
MDLSDSIPTSDCEIDAKRQRMTALLDSLAVEEGSRPSTILPSVSLIRASRSLPRMPVLYEPSIVVVGRGRKRGYLGDDTFVYDAYNYLVLTVPMPFECETEVEEAGPLLAFKVRIDIGVLSELMMKTDSRLVAKTTAQTRGCFATPMDDKLLDVCIRLLESMSSAADARILGPQVIRELTYRVLTGVHGGALRELLTLNGKVGQIQLAIERMHENYSSPFDVQSMADEIGISASAFHHNFKALTATSPLQYLKTIRLHKAKMLMVHEDISAQLASERVGYESASQFSREFKRLFGLTPVQEVSQTRDRLAINKPVLTAFQVTDMV